MYCIECGEKIKHTDAYCSKCGARQINPVLLNAYEKQTGSIMPAKQKDNNKPISVINNDDDADITRTVEKAGSVFIGLLTLLCGIVLGVCTVGNIGYPLFFGSAAAVCTIISVYVLLKKSWALIASGIMYLIMMLGMIILLPAYAVNMDWLPSVIILMLIATLFAVIILINAIYKYSVNKVS